MQMVANAKEDNAKPHLQNTPEMQDMQVSYKIILTSQLHFDNLEICVTSQADQGTMSRDQ